MPVHRLAMPQSFKVSKPHMDLNAHSILQQSEKMVSQPHSREDGQFPRLKQAKKQNPKSSKHRKSKRRERKIKREKQDGENKNLKTETLDMGMSGYSLLLSSGLNFLYLHFSLLLRSFPSLPSGGCSSCYQPPQGKLTRKKKVQTHAPKSMGPQFLPWAFFVFKPDPSSHVPFI